MDSRQSSQSSKASDSPHGGRNIWQGSPSRIHSVLSWDTMMQDLSIHSSSPSGSGTPNHGRGISHPVRQLSGALPQSFPNQRTTSGRMLFPEQQQQQQQLQQLQQPPPFPLRTARSPSSYEVTPILSSRTGSLLGLHHQPSLHPLLSPNSSSSLPNQRSLPAHFSPPAHSPMFPPEQRSASSYVPSQPIRLPLQRTGSGRLQLSEQIHRLEGRNPAENDASMEQPPRPLTRRGMDNVDGRSASASMPILQPRSQLIPDNPPPPQPTGQIALYMTMYEGRSRSDDPFNVKVHERRNCSIIAQLHPQSEKFREFCCIPSSHAHRQAGLRHLRFYSTPEIPNPRFASPGLLAMYFIGWVPWSQIQVLDQIMRLWRRRITREWTHFTWIKLYLELLLAGLYITESKVAMLLQRQKEALSCQWTTNLPNHKWCFPHLHQCGTPK